MSFRLRPRAQQDLTEITRYIAQRNAPAARQLIEKIRASCRTLGDNPEIGVERDDVAPGLRLFPVGNYLILYRQADFGAEIVRVLHGARQWKDLLS